MSIDRYADIIHLDRPVSKKHPPMSRENRAAQFASFAALTGYGDAVEETARYTASRPILTEDKIAMLDRKLAHIANRLEEDPLVLVTYFKADPRKAGGACVTAEGVVRDVDSLKRELVLDDGRRIAIPDIVGLESDLFPVCEDD